MKLKKNSSEKKILGAYYTTPELIEAMVDKIKILDDINILEPSFGDGRFIDAIVNNNGNVNITGVEINNVEVSMVLKKYDSYDNVSIQCNDFFEFYNKEDKEKYDLIIGNPPYIRYQYLSDIQRDNQSKILVSNGMKSNKLINAWVAFVVACVNMLRENGELVFVLPAEILQVAYAEDLRLFLSNHLEKITIVAFKELVFPEIEQEVVVFIGKKGTDDSVIRIIEFNDIDEFKKSNIQNVAFQPISHVKEKWIKYFITNDEANLINTIRHDDRFKEFSEYGTINVGITTGNNKYFSVTDKEADDYDLNSVCLPLIGRSAHAKGIYFTEDNWRNNLKENKRAKLISFPNIPIEDYPLKHKEYILYGENNEVNNGYKCSIRDRWYIVPSIWIPDAFFLRRSNLYPKLVINKCNAVSTDTMHRIKLNEHVNYEYLLLSYYNSISFAFTEICGRSYGGGVLELLPSEVSKVRLPYLKFVDNNSLKKGIEIINNVLTNDIDIEKVLNYTDEIIIKNTDIPKSWFDECRYIWKKLQRRRLERN